MLVVLDHENVLSLTTEVIKFTYHLPALFPAQEVPIEIARSFKQL